MDEQSIRSVIDEIALQVVVCDPEREDLQSVVGDKTMEYKSHYANGSLDFLSQSLIA